MEVQENSCGYCGQKSFKTCSACKQIYYCSKEHQKNDWKNHKKNCKPFTIKKDAKKGRCLVASSEISSNRIIFKEEPLIIGPRFVEPEPVCVGCLQPLELLKSSKCPTCNWPICSANCEKLEHKYECEILKAGKNLTRGNYRYELILPLRCLLLQKYDKSKWEKILAMESHIEERTPDTDVYREVEEIYTYLKENFLHNSETEDITQNDFHRICGIIDVNCLEVPHKSTELSALYHTFSFLEHSCLPNVKISFNKFNVEVYSATSIGRDEHISTMYTNIIWGTQTRQQHLLSTKYFLCDCIRCKDPTELGTQFSSLKCLQDNCTSYLLPENPLVFDTIWKCTKCEASLPAKDVNDIVSRLTYEVDRILQIKNPSIKQIENHLEKLQSLLHPHHYNCFSIKHSLIQLYGQQQGYLYNQLENATLTRKINYCRELLLILTKLDKTQSRAPLYLAIIKYELSSAILETMKRRLTETLNLESIQDDAKEAKDRIKQTVLLLSEESSSPMHYPMIQSCKNLYREIQDLSSGLVTDL